MKCPAGCVMVHWEYQSPDGKRSLHKGYTVTVELIRAAATPFLVPGLVADETAKFVEALYLAGEFD